MKQSLTILFFLLLATLSAQSTISGTVFDADNSSAIPFVSIGVLTETRGTVSNEKGRYTLDRLSPDQTIRFSAIGYQDRDFKVADLVKISKVELEVISYEIPTVIVEQKAFNGPEKRYGVINKKGRGPAIGFGNAELGAAIGAVIEFDEPTYLKRADFVIVHAKGDSMFFRVNIQAYKDGEVGTSLLLEDIIVKKKQASGLFSVDLSDLGLVIDQDILLSLEWIRNDGENGNENLTFDLAKQKPGGVHMRFSSQSEFRNSAPRRKYKPCFSLIGREVL